ncbi:MAG: hypothetical protein QMC89_06490 [Candidatus Hodarchaeaceae archaeon]|nr:hypothetical protein [Candidatus Hodarchaeaceae archaeon]
MAGKWHNTIVEILEELCQEWVEQGYYKKVCDGNANPITVSYKKTPYYYQPDLYAIRPKSEKVDIYEVVDTESEGEAVMDIVYSALTPRVNLLLLVCSDGSKLQAIKGHAEIILNKMLDEDGKPFSKKMYSPRYFVHIPREMRNRKKN